MKKGDRVELIHTTDSLTRLKPGDQGVVIDIEGEIGDRMYTIKWDRGEVLGLLEAFDQFKRVIKK